MKPLEFLFIIQARMGSQRLPKKAIYPICGIPLIFFLIKRLKGRLGLHNTKTILATTTHPEDEVIAEIGKTANIDVFRGFDDDVMGRYFQCLEKYPASYICRVTGDNPLTCPRIFGFLSKSIITKQGDYIQAKGLPVGSWGDIFSKQSLISMNQQATSSFDREHINSYILNNPRKFKVITEEFTDELNRPDLSFTVDTHADWQKIINIFHSNETEPWKLSLREAITRMDARGAS